jgi:hypothetical protein
MCERRVLALLDMYGKQTVFASVRNDQAHGNRGA